MRTVITTSLLFIVALAGLTTAVGAADRVAGEPEPHTPPVDAAVIDPFRPPEHRFGPGNRGLEYGTVAGQAVRASAPGTVTFAGQVGGQNHVTVRHDASLVTTVSFLETIAVSVGDRVRQGSVLGRTGPVSLHFSARRDGTYIDPASLFVVPSYGVRLIPVA